MNNITEHLCTSLPVIFSVANANLDLHEVITFTPDELKTAVAELFEPPDPHASPHRLDAFAYGLAVQAVQDVDWTAVKSALENTYRDAENQLLEEFAAIDVDDRAEVTDPDDARQLLVDCLPDLGDRTYGGKQAIGDNDIDWTVFLEKAATRGLHTP